MLCAVIHLIETTLINSVVTSKVPERVYKEQACPSSHIGNTQVTLSTWVEMRQQALASEGSQALNRSNRHQPGRRKIRYSVISKKSGIVCLTKMDSQYRNFPIELLKTIAKRPQSGQDFATIRLTNNPMKAQDIDSATKFRALCATTVR